MIKKNPPNGSSHAQLLQSSAIVGGAQVMNYLIAAVRVKIVALLLGPSGVGLLSIYIAAMGPLQTIAGWGLDTSGVRQIAKSQNDPNSNRVAEIVSTLRRACTLMGLVGCILSAALAYPLSHWTFGTSDHTWAFVALGPLVFLNIVTGAEQAVMLGSRRVGDFARVSILSAITGTATVALIYLFFGAAGIVPALLATAATHYGISAWFAKRIESGHSGDRKNFRETISGSKTLFVLGSAFMYRALLATLAALIIRAFILSSFGIDAIGYYQAAWALSVLFANFVTAAMGADFLPRLTAASDNDEICSKLVNEQTEVGILLALPGTLASLMISPVLVYVFYTEDFLPAAELLPWLTMGVFLQVITFPTGMVQEAKGRTLWIYLSQTHYHILSVALAMFLINEFGLVGAAWSFTITTCMQGLIMSWIAYRISSVQLSRETLKLASCALAFIVISLIVNELTTGSLRFLLELSVVVAGTFFSLYSLSARIGKETRLGRLLAKLPRF